MDYTEQERLVFRYHDGGRERFADPLPLYRALVKGLRGAALGGEGGLLEQLEQGDEYLAGDAAAKLFPAVAAAFGLEPFDPDTGQGCTERMLYRVLLDFLAYLDDAKKAPGSSPTCSPPTEPGSAAAGASRTPSGSASG